MDLDWTQTATAGVTLVTVQLRNERASDRRVRLANRLDGPVLPPRRHGVPEAGWEREEVTTVVPAGGTTALGYACPAPAATPPVSLEAIGAPGDGASATATDAARSLGDHRPPSDVLRSGGESDGPDTTDKTGTNDTTAATRTTPPGGAADGPTPAIPEEANPLSVYRERVETAEALGAVGVPAAASLLEASGGLTGVESLAAGLHADARVLRAIAAAAERLADRADAATPPTEALARLS
ncbi:hypothetical protein [Halolamina litorea]|uniref:DUF8080 domain-containing protein n=1 Tax=Halolamina litorea TaxID=1515593 RepID=A0ABD6BR67_9EURY|nr:hypothetical protein [Halolamina litorea]